MKKPKHYYCHRTSTQNQSIPKQYEMINKIGQGAFGQVYKVFNSQTSSIEVIKKNKGESIVAMSKQSEIMKEMNSSDGFAKIKEADMNEGFLVMTLLGDSLETVMQTHALNLVDMKRIAYQLIQRLRELHERGFVHRDLKPDNVLLGNQSNPHKIYLVDFGLSSSYKKKAVVARKCYAGEIGTIKFCPLASHNCLEQFPKDDLQSLGYLLIYISTKGLPWSRLSKALSEKQQFDEIKKRKQQTQIQKLCNGISCLRKYLHEVRSLKVGGQVDYDRLLGFFQIKCEDYFCFSFCRESCFARLKGVQEKQNDVDQRFEVGESKQKVRRTDFRVVR